MDAARSLNSVQAMKTETVQTRQLFRISECTHTHRTGYFIMKIVKQGLYIHGKGRKQGYFLKILAYLLTIKGMALRMNNKVLSCDPDLNSVLLTNQIVFLDMFWSFDGIIINILYFREFIISSSSWRRQAFPLEVVKKVGGEQERGIRSKKFARQAKAWTTEIVWIFVYTHTGYKRITHGFRFTYKKEYPHPPGNLLQHELNSDVALLITAHKKKILQPLYLL